MRFIAGGDIVGDMNSVGAAVRHLRKLRKIKQTELARRMGMSQGHVSDLERGDVTWTETTIRAAATALGVSAGALIDIADTVTQSGQAA